MIVSIHRDLWYGPARIGDDTESYSLNQSRTIVERTGISAGRRRRRDAGLNDGKFSISGLYDTDTLATLKAGDSQTLYEAINTNLVPFPVRRVTGIAIPEDSNEFPVGNFMSLSTEATFDNALEDMDGLVYRKTVTRQNTGVTTLQSAAQRFDYGGAAYTPDDRKVELVVNIEDYDAPATVTAANLVLQHSSDGSAWVNAGTLSIAARGGAPPLWRTVSADITNLRRYLGLIFSITAGAGNTAEVTFSAFVKVTEED